LLMRRMALASAAFAEAILGGRYRADPAKVPYMVRKVRKISYEDASKWTSSADVGLATLGDYEDKLGRPSFFAHGDALDRRWKIVLSLALSRDTLQHLDIATIPVSLLTRDTRNRLVFAYGTSVIPECNRFHYEGNELREPLIRELVFASRTTVCRVGLPQILELVVLGYNRRWFDLESIPRPSLRDQVAKLLKKKGVVFR